MDLNCDLGESYGVWTLGDDDAMLEVVTSANVACGFHGGDPTTIRRVCDAAAERGVAIGAQVSYPDLAGFGRRALDIAPEDLRNAVLYQIGALDAFARAAGSAVSYVKPHGALYHACVDDRAQAEAVLAAVTAFDRSLAILALPGSALVELAADTGHPAVGEAFADRAYTGEARLVPRSHPAAMITDPGEAALRARRLAVEHKVATVDGGDVSIRCGSICVHGDTPGAPDIARAVRAALESAGLGPAPFTSRA
jgi:UPF0271 protein